MVDGLTGRRLSLGDWLTGELGLTGLREKRLTESQVDEWTVVES